MENKRVSILFALLVFCIVSCSKDNVKKEYLHTYTIEASFNKNETKTELDNSYVPHWELYDEVWLSTGNPETATIGIVTAISEEKGVATITTSLDISGGQVFAVYPYINDEAYSVTGDGDIVFEIPSLQDGAFRSSHICVAAGSKMKGLSFKNATSMFMVAGRTPDVARFVFEKEGIAGKYAFSFKDNSVSPVETTNSVTAQIQKGNAGPFFVAVACGISYSDGEAIAKWCKSSGACLSTKKASKDIKLERSRIYNLGNTYSTIDGVID